MTLAGTPLLLLFLIVPRWAVGIFGSDFEKGGILLSILVIGQFVNVSTGSVGYLIMISGNGRMMKNNVVFGAILSVVLNVILVSMYGSIGAVIAVALCLIIKNLIAPYFLSSSRLGIWIIPFISRNVGGVVYK